MPTNDDTRLEEVVEEGISAHMNEVHTALPGVIQSFDAGKQTANIALCNKSVYEDLNGDPKSEKYAILPNVPIASIGAGGITISMPLAKGDSVLVVFAESDINNFRDNGKADNEPGLLNRHSLNGGIAIPCNITNKSYSNTASEGGSEIIITGGGTTDFVALSQKVTSNLNAIKNALDLHQHTVTADGTPAGTPVGKSIPLTPPDYVTPILTSVACSKLKTE